MSTTNRRDWGLAWHRCVLLWFLCFPFLFCLLLTSVLLSFQPGVSDGLFPPRRVGPAITAFKNADPYYRNRIHFQVRIGLPETLIAYHRKMCA